MDSGPFAMIAACTPSQLRQLKLRTETAKNRTSTSHLDFVISIRMYRYVIFESQKANDCSKVNLLRKPIFLSSSTCASQAPRVVSRNAPFAPYVHPSLNRTIAVPSSGDVIV